MRINGIDWTAMALVLIGGLNWGLVGFFNWNLVDAIFGADSALSRVVYALVGLSAVYLVAMAARLVNVGTRHHHHPAV